jgi:hypothetical protein
VAREVPSVSIVAAEYDDERMDILDVSDMDLINHDMASRFQSSWVTGETLSFKTAGVEPLVVMFFPLASELSREWLLIPLSFETPRLSFRRAGELWTWSATEFGFRARRVALCCQI